MHQFQSYSFSTKRRLRLLRPFKKTQPDTPGLRPTNKKATSLLIRGTHAHENTLASVDNTSTFFSARLRWTKGQGECGEMRLEGCSVKDSTTMIRLHTFIAMASVSALIGVYTALRLGSTLTNV
ncbi:hypothetical protein BDZ94DRAFT_1327625 [Collybia nuda]|uniref:Uncharacterized protein n=1 Tax=Collybia nuda TaxID=64659 RepID=A0A9P5XRC7_9AGAR|nr:hypothetical protein BDZ94DRAFT_1327625 [Collybia nuda]